MYVSIFKKGLPMNSRSLNSLVSRSPSLTLRSAQCVFGLTAANRAVIMNPQTSDPQMNISSTRSAAAPIGSCSFSGCRAILAMGLSLAFLGLTTSARAQATVSDDFNSGPPDTAQGWAAYEGSPGTREVRYVPDG